MRIFPKHAWLMVLGLVLVMVASSCGGTTSSGATPTTATSAPTTNEGAGADPGLCSL